MRRAARAASVGLVLLLATAVLATLLLIYRPHPVLDGDLRTLGMHERGEILRDRYGVPHIFARNAHDLFYMQGYVLAQDRLFQMDLYRRAAHGRLSEVLGPATLEADMLTRTLSLSLGAQRDLLLLSDEARAAAEAFAAGVNKYLQQHGESLPLEFVLLGYRPDLWSPVDSLAILKLQAYDQAVNFETELLRTRVAQRLGVSAIPALFPEPDGTPPLDAAWARISPYLGGAVDGSEAATGPSGAGQLKAILGDAGPGAGSNCWALAGSRTQSGKPLLAGDPHLGVRNPSIWYELALEGAGYRVAGFTIPGVPGVILGHNDRIAWSLTVAYVDQQDLYLERPDPAAPAGQQWFLYGASSEQATVDRHSIRVKGRESVPFDVVSTRHGPIITPVVKGVTAPLSLRWTALDGGQNLDGILALDRARDWDSFIRAVALVEGPALTLCYADVDGHIGYALAGRAPVRVSQEDGRLPLPGWTGANEWAEQGSLADARPTPTGGGGRFVRDPAEGLVVIANQRWLSLDRAGSPAEWDPGFRAARARAVLEPAHGVTSEDLRRLQSDIVAADIRPLRGLIERLPLAGNDSVARARELVREWDGRLAPESAGAAVYEAFVLHLLSVLLEERFGDELLASYLADARPLLAARGLADGAAAVPWRDVLGARSLEDVAVLAFRGATQELVRRQGDDPARWRWGGIHRITFAHPLGSAIPLGLLNIGPHERGGDDDTINDAPYDPSKPYDVRTHASLRTIVDLGDIDASWSVLPTGQSGQAGSPHWGDQTQLWLRGELKPMPLSRERLDAPHRLVLRAR